MVKALTWNVGDLRLESQSLHTFFWLVTYGHPYCPLSDIQPHKNLNVLLAH